MYEDEHLKKYYSSDEFYYKEIEYKTYDDICYSIKDHTYDTKPLVIIAFAL